MKIELKDHEVDWLLGFLRRARREDFIRDGMASELIARCEAAGAVPDICDGCGADLDPNSLVTRGNSIYCSGECANA